MLEQDVIEADEIAVRQVCAGNTREFEGLVRRHFGRVFMIAYANLGNREAAEDLSQEVFLRSWLHLDSLKDQRSFPAWIVRIARNLALTWKRNGQRSSRLLPLIQIEDMPMDISDRERLSPREEVQVHQEQDRLRQAAINLPANLREIVLLHYGEGLSQAEIAHSLGVSRAAVNKQHSRALAMLRINMDSELRGAVDSIVPSQSAKQRVIAMAAAMTGLSATSKAALAAACTDTIALGGSSVAAAAAVKAGLSSLSSVKAIAAVVVLTGILGTGVYTVSRTGRMGSGPRSSSFNNNAKSKTLNSIRVAEKPGQPANLVNVGARDEQNTTTRTVSVSEPHSPIETSDNSANSGSTSGPAGDTKPKRIVGSGEVSGVVLEKDSGIGVPGVTVWLRPVHSHPDLEITTTTTDDASQFTFQNVPAGSWVFGGSKGSLGLTPTDPIQMREGQTTSGIVLHLYAGHTMTGRVTAIGTGAPLAGVAIHPGFRSSGELDPTVMGLTDDNGSYRIEKMLFETMPPKSLRLFVPVKKGYVLVTPVRSPTVYGMQIEPRSASTEITCDMEMAPTVVISGRVLVDSQKAAAAATVSVGASSLHGWRVSPVTANAHGEFELMAPKGINVTLVAEDKNLGVGYSKHVATGERGVRDVEIRLSPRTRVVGSVTDPAGKPVAGAEVELTEWVTAAGNRNGNVKSSVTDESGKFVISGISRTEITLRAKKKGFTQSLPRTARPETAKDTTVQLQLRKSHYLAGQVTEKDRQPLAGVRIDVFSTAMGDIFSEQATTDIHGRYRIEGLTEEPVSVNLHHTDVGQRSFHSVQVDRDDADFSFVDQLPQFIGNVVDWKTGAPIQEFTVTWPEKTVKDPKTPGRFTTDMHHTHFDFRIEAPGFAPMTEKVRAPDGAQGYEHVFRMGSGAIVTGRIVGPDKTSPIAGAQLLLAESPNPGYYEGKRRELTAGEDGRFRIDMVCVGWNNLTVAPDDPLRSITRTVIVKQGETKELGDIVVTGPGAITGRVLKMPERLPLVDAVVELRDDLSKINRAASTNASGEFEFRDLPNGDFNVTQREHDLSARFQISEGATHNLSLEIWPGKLIGRLLHGDKPMTQADITIGRNGVTWYLSKKSTLKDGGAFEYSGLGPGEWKLNVQYPLPSRIGWVDFPVLIPDIGNLQKDFVVPSTLLQVTVVDANENPVPGANIEAKAVAGSIAQSGPGNVLGPYITAINGTCLVYDLAPGPYYVTAVKENVGKGTVPVEVPKDGESQETTISIR